MINEEKARIKTLKAIQKELINPYPSQCKRTHTCKQVKEDFNQLLKQKKSIILAGRICLLRAHGKICFVDLKDGTGRFQAFFRQNNLGEKNYQLFSKHLDLGDFIQVKGKLFKTKRGEPTLEVKDWKILSKALLPLPEKWHGLENIETRYRQRYLDLIANPEVVKIFQVRSHLVKLIREFLDEKGFQEVETPILQPLAGGAAAKPFITKHQALNTNLYLRIAPELYLKRLVIGGIDKVYEIARCFRNEGIDWAHNPEFTQVEFYQAYANYEDLIKLTEEFFKFILKQLGHKDLKIDYQGKKLNFKPPYPRIDFREALLKQTSIDIDKHKNFKSLAKASKKFISVNPKWNKGKLLDELYKATVRSKIIQPAFIINHPIELSPLAKKITDRPNYVERFQLLVAGSEICNAFSEVNNPLDQSERFKEQQKLLKAGDEEAQPADQDFIEALKYGMPPTAGQGIGIDRLVGLLTDQHNIRESILFPILRQKTKVQRKLKSKKR